MLEWKTLIRPECTRYVNAINRMKQILEKIKEGEMVLDDKRHLVFSNSLYLKFPNESQELLLAIVEELSEKNPEGFNAILARHGKNLLYYYDIPASDCKIYCKAIKKIKKEIKDRKEEIKKQLKKTLTSNKEELYLIKERRRGVNTLELAQKYHLSEEDIYRIYAKNIILFGDLTPTIMEEILLNSQSWPYYLMESENFTFLLKLVSTKTILMTQRKLLETKRIQDAKELTMLNEYLSDRIEWSTSNSYRKLYKE